MALLSMSDVVKNIRDLPALPVIVIELMSTLDEDEAGSNDLADRLSRDQALTAKTLRLANSSFYGMQSKVTSIQQAIAILGFNGVRGLVTTAAIIGGFSSNEHAGFDFSGFWRHSIATAVCAKNLARQLKINQDYAFMIGLLHDIGRLVLVTGSADHYAKVTAFQQDKDSYPIEAEREVLGIDHAMVGSALAAHWKFPPVMQKAILDHHAPLAEQPPSFASAIHAADCIAHGLDLSGVDNDMVPPMSESIWKNLNLGQDTLAEIYRESESQFEEACQVLLAMKA
ncbi:MAG TPA: HDOD domain-containing protein [Burkholderiaceae bacterium]|jgi:putative nucleotidyltransferase with HDIG domain